MFFSHPIPTFLRVSWFVRLDEVEDSKKEGWEVGQMNVPFFQGGLLPKHIDCREGS